MASATWIPVGDMLTVASTVLVVMAVMVVSVMMVMSVPCGVIRLVVVVVVAWAPRGCWRVVVYGV